MDKVSKDIKTIHVNQEFRICPNCDYQRGFHVSFVPEGNDKQLQLVLICPNCGSRYEIGKLI